MCCSSGRRSSLTDPEEYGLPYPSEQVCLPDFTAELTSRQLTESYLYQVDNHMSPNNMIIEMVRFASILLRAARQLYHSVAKVSEQRKSTIAAKLDEDLVLWRANLPFWLQPDYQSFTEPEWVGKQRLVLQLRTIISR